MDENQDFEKIKEIFDQADLDEKIEIYTSLEGLTIEQFKELLSVFPIKHLDKLETALG